MPDRTRVDGIVCLWMLASACTVSQPDTFDFGSPGGRVTPAGDAEVSTSSAASDAADTIGGAISATGGAEPITSSDGSDATMTTGAVPTSDTGSSSEQSTTSGPSSVCGDGMAELSEACDGEDLRGATCWSEGFGNGTLVCADDCELDASGCSDPACATSIEPPGGPCPPACTNGCDQAAKTCYVDCIGPGACSNATVTCPDDWACHIMCAGGGACTAATLRCPTDYDCWIVCDGSSPCDHAIFECGDAPCSITCTGGSPCAGSTLRCGYGDASLQCVEVSYVQPAPVAVPDVQAECACTVDGC